jgi:hypothetical protein
MYRFIDSLPIEPEDIENSHRSLEDNNNYLRYLRLSHKSISAIERVSDLQSYLSKAAADTALSSSNEQTIKFLIESYVVTLLYTNTISNPSRSYRSPHYIKRTEDVTPYKPKPPLYYREEIALSNLRTWGGLYGMPSYCLHILGNTDHYLSTFEIADITINYYLNLLSTNREWQAFAEVDYLKDGTEVDEYIYRLSHYLITEDSEIRQTYLILKFLSSFIPKAIEAYKEDIEDVQKDKFLSEICHLLITYGLDNIGPYLEYLFIHQSLTNNWNEVYIDLIRLRKRAPSEVSHPLSKLFISSIPITTREDLYIASSNKILSWLCPPGGFNMYLLIVSISLLCRAYALCCSEEQDLPRVNKLMYLSSLCLRKSQLEHIQKIGNNILLLTRQQYIPSPTDLLI